MRKLIGTINCDQNKSIEKGAEFKVSVLDCSLACAPSKTLGTVSLRNINNFPVSYEIQYDDSNIIRNTVHGYTVGVRIEKDDKLLFINDTSHSIISDDGNILDNVNVTVISIN
jgi:uncharacterized lipoprotein YbaY